MNKEVTTFLDTEQWIVINFLRYMIQEDCAKEDILSVLKYIEWVNLSSMYDKVHPGEIEENIQYYKNEYKVVEVIGKYLKKEPYNSGHEDLEDESDERARNLRVLETLFLVTLFNDWSGCDAASDQA